MYSKEKCISAFIQWKREERNEGVLVLAQATCWNMNRGEDSGCSMYTTTVLLL